MAVSSGYRLVIGILIIIFVSLLWIPLNYVFGIAGGVLNTGITDTDAISRNNMMVMGFYYTLFVIILATIIYIVKPTKGDGEEEGDTAYAPFSG